LSEMDTDSPEILPVTNEMDSPQVLPVTNEMDSPELEILSVETNEPKDDSDAPRKIFLLAGSWTESEKYDINQKINTLGGSLLDQVSYDGRCTHVIANKFEMSEKNMGALAAGKWVVTRRFLEKSITMKAWQSEKPFIFDYVVLKHRKLWIDTQGGCFSGMKVVFLMDDEERKRSVYMRIVRAGSGEVDESINLKTLKTEPPRANQITHVIVDPSILKENHPYYADFKSWRELADNTDTQNWENGQLYYVHYKFLTEKLSKFENVTEATFSISKPGVQKLAARLKPSHLPKRRNVEPLVRPNKKRKTNNGVINVDDDEVVCIDVDECVTLSDGESDDDVQLLENAYASENRNGYIRRDVQRRGARGESYKEKCDREKRNLERKEIEKKKALAAAARPRNRPRRREVFDAECIDVDYEPKPGPSNARIHDVINLDSDSDDEVEEIQVSDSDNDEPVANGFSWHQPCAVPRRPSAMEVDRDERNDNSDDEIEIMNDNKSSIDLVLAQVKEREIFVTVSDDEDSSYSMSDGEDEDSKPYSLSDVEESLPRSVTPPEDEHSVSQIDLIPVSQINGIKKEKLNGHAKLVQYSPESSEDEEDIARGLFYGNDAPRIKKLHKKVSNENSKTLDSAELPKTPLKSGITVQSSDEIQDKFSESFPRMDNLDTSLTPPKLLDTLRLEKPLTKQSDKEEQHLINSSSKEETTIVQDMEIDTIPPQMSPETVSKQENLENKISPTSETIPPQIIPETESKQENKMPETSLASLLVEKFKKKDIKDKSLKPIHTVKHVQEKSPKQMVSTIPIEKPVSTIPIEKPVSTIPIKTPVEKLPIVPEKKQIPAPKVNTKLDQLLTTLLHRQEGTEECIAISNINARTAKFDKVEEVHEVKLFRIREMDSANAEEIRGKFETQAQNTRIQSNDRRKQYKDDFDEVDDIDGEEKISESDLVRSLNIVNLHTNIHHYPSSATINCLIFEYFLRQKSTWVVQETYAYMKKFLFLHPGLDRSDRLRWLEMILSSMRDCPVQESFPDFSINNQWDIHDCWKFFKNLLNQVLTFHQNKESRETENGEDFDQNTAVEDNYAGAEALLTLLVETMQRDFEIWCKHLRRKTEVGGKPAQPLIFYLLGGEKDFDQKGCPGVKHFYAELVKSRRDASDARKMVAMTALLTSYRDSLEGNRADLLMGQKLQLADSVAAGLKEARLNEQELFIELSLLQPNWFSALVSKSYCQKKVKLGKLENLIGNLDNLSLDDGRTIACIDNWAHRTCGFLHWHTISRANWHFNDHPDEEFLVFRNMKKLLKRKGSRLKLVEFKNDVHVSTKHIVSAVSIVQQLQNKRDLGQDFGALNSLLFKMKDLDIF